MQTSARLDPIPLPRPSRRVAARQVGSQLVLVPTARRASELGAVYTLNEVAARIWELLPTARCVDDIVDALLAEYQADRLVLRADVLGFLADGIAAGVLEVTE